MPAAAIGVPEILKPGAAVRVRTRTAVVMAAKTVEIWLWLPATVVSAAADGRSYEVVYKGKLPPGDPFATVHVAHDHVVLEKEQPDMSSCASAANSHAAAASKSSEMVSAPRPTTAGKSMRLIRDLTSEAQPHATAEADNGWEVPARRPEDLVGDEARAEADDGGEERARRLQPRTGYGAPRQGCIGGILSVDALLLCSRLVTVFCLINSRTDLHIKKKKISRTDLSSKATLCN